MNTNGVSRRQWLREHSELGICVLLAALGVVVLVDAYTSGKYLPPEFAALGADLVHVQSTPEFMPSMPAPDLGPYRAALVHQDVDRTVARLAPYRPVAVLAGALVVLLGRVADTDPQQIDPDSE